MTQQINVSKVSVKARGYDPSQPRVPAGQDGGGRWTDGAGGSDGGQSSFSDWSEATEYVNSMVDRGLLSASERSLIYRYTDEDDQLGDINAAMRAGKSDQRAVDALSMALARLPRWNGVSERGLWLTPEQQKRLQKEVDAGTYTLSGFTSSGVHKRLSGNTIFRFDSSRGAAVFGLSAVPHEGEVIFSPGNRFRVESAQNEKVAGSDRFVVTLVDPEKLR